MYHSPYPQCQSLKRRRIILKPITWHSTGSQFVEVPFKDRIELLQLHEKKILIIFISFPSLSYILKRTRNLLNRASECEHIITIRMSECVSRMHLNIISLSLCWGIEMNEKDKFIWKCRTKESADRKKTIL